MKFNVLFPILGFENIKEYELEKIDDLFFSLKSLDNKISFTLINPFMLIEYDFSITKESQEKLGINENSNIVTLNTVTVATPLENSTINFAAPIVFNFDTSKMGQFILEDSQYELAEPLNKFIK